MTAKGNVANNGFGICGNGRQNFQLLRLQREGISTVTLALKEGIALWSSC